MLTWRYRESTVNDLKVYTLRESNSDILFLPPFKQDPTPIDSIGVLSYRYLSKGFVLQESQQEVIKVVSL